MYHHHLGIVIIILLVIIALFLLVGILAVGFWILLLVLREWLQTGRITKKKKRRKKHKKYSEKIADLKIIEKTDKGPQENFCPPNHLQTPKYRADIKKDLYYNHNIAEAASREKNKQSLQENVNPYDDLEKMMKFIRGRTKPDGIYLKKKSSEGEIELAIAAKTNKVILEKAENMLDAIFVLYGKNKEGKYIILPCDEEIREKELIYGGISSCFRMNTNLDRHLVYKITGVKKPCLAKKLGENYYIEEADKGELKIELSNTGK